MKKNFHVYEFQTTSITTSQTVWKISPWTLGMLRQSCPKLSLHQTSTSQMCNMEWTRPSWRSMSGSKCKKSNLPQWMLEPVHSFFQMPCHDLWWNLELPFELLSLKQIAALPEIVTSDKKGSTTMLYSSTYCKNPIFREYYFSEENLQRDFFLRRKMDSEGYIPIALVASFHRVQALTPDVALIIHVSKACLSLKKKAWWS